MFVIINPLRMLCILPINKVSELIMLRSMDSASGSVSNVGTMLVRYYLPLAKYPIN